jgi:hypothetical protein
MRTDEQSEDRFDGTLRRALRTHSEPVPADFTEQMLHRIRELESRRILTKVVWQGRLALAGSILAGIAAVVAVVVFPARAAAFLSGIGGGFLERGAAFAERASQAAGFLGDEWQITAILAILLGFAVFCLVDLLLGDRMNLG